MSMRALLIWWGHLFIQVGEGMMEAARKRAEVGRYE